MVVFFTFLIIISMVIVFLFMIVYDGRSLYSRILNFTNIMNGYNLTNEGQEGFTIIQYNPGDEYT